MHLLMKHYYYFWQSPLGKIFLFANESSLKALIYYENSAADFHNKGARRHPTGTIIQAKEEDTEIEACINRYHPIAKKNSVIALAIKELTAYFKGQLTHFTVAVEPEGTVFQRQAWKVLQGIQYGEVISYSEQAVRLRKPKAMRAVGQANGKNPIPIIIPCHRVVAKNKTIGGYSGGIVIKQKLLAIENSLLPSMCGN